MLLAGAEEARRAACRRIFAFNGAVFAGDAGFAGLPVDEIGGFLDCVGIATACWKAQVKPVNCTGGQADGAYIQQESMLRVCMCVERNPVEGKV